MTEMRGIVTRILPYKGFGFIKGDDGMDRFFHAERCIPNGCFETLRAGATVEFQDEEGRDGKGPRAIDVKVAV